MPVSWKLWREELKAPSPEDNRHNRENDRLAITGYWRIDAARTKANYPVAIWTEAGKEDVATIFQIGNQVRNTADHAEEWAEFQQKTWLSCVAVSRETWDIAMNTGFWPNAEGDKRDPLMARKMTADERLGIDLGGGGNQAPTPEALLEMLDRVHAKVKATPAPTDQDEADAATGLLDLLRRLMQLTEIERKKAKQPHLDAADAVDATFNDQHRTPAGLAGKRLADERDAWLTKEKARLQKIADDETARLRKIAADEAAARNAEAAAEAERKNAELAEQAKAMGMEAPAERVEPEHVEAAYVPPVAAPKVTAGSTTGRHVSAPKVAKVAYVTDAAALANYLLFGPNGADEDFVAYLGKKAAAAYRSSAKIILPGATVMTEAEFVQWTAKQAAGETTNG